MTLFFSYNFKFSALRNNGIQIFQINTCLLRGIILLSILVKCSFIFSLTRLSNDLIFVLKQTYEIVISIIIIIITTIFFKSSVQRFVGVPLCRLSCPEHHLIIRFIFVFEMYNISCLSSLLFLDTFYNVFQSCLVL